MEERSSFYAEGARCTTVIGDAAAVFLLFDVIGRFVEAMGAVRCGCSPACWCHRPFLSMFGWVFPYGHQPGTDG